MKHGSLRLFSDSEYRQLSRNDWLAGLELHEQVESTNLLGLGCDPHVPTPHLIVAERQTGGRGRGANRWWGSDGCLMFSLVLDFPSLGIAEHRRAVMSLVTGLAMWRAVAPLVDPAQLKLKWPNDLYYQGRKVCGILLQASAAGPAAQRVVVGIGLNVHNRFDEAPAEVRERATSLSESGASPGRLFDVLDVALETLRSEYEWLAQGRSDLARRWSDRCLLRNKQVTLQVAGNCVSGRCLGVNDDGSLSVDDGAGERRFVSGEVQTVR